MRKKKDTAVNPIIEKARPSLTLDTWQKEVLATEGNICLCSGRQTGKSTIIAIKTAEFMRNHPHKRVIIISITEDQAELMVMKILDYLEKNYKGMIAKGKFKPTKHQIRLTNGSQVRCRPVGNTGDAVRGFTGDLLIADEAAFMPESIWSAAKPTLLTTAGKIILVSTPKGKQGYFWESFQNKNERFKVFHVNSEEVIQNRQISETWTELQREQAIKFLQQEKADMSELQYAQEYMGEFVDDLRKYFPDELIEAVCTGKHGDGIKQDRDYYLGVDIARMGDDESTFEVIDKLSSTNLIHVENTITKKTRTTQTEEKIIYMNRLYNFRNIYIDAGSGSLGVGIFDMLLRNDETKRKVVPINNRARPMDKEGKSKSRLMKEDLYDNLRSLMEKRQIVLLDDESVKLSLRSIQYEYTKNPKGITTIRIFGNYSHVVEGLIRAAWCSKEKNLNLWVHAI